MKRRKKLTVLKSKINSANKSGSEIVTLIYGALFGVKILPVSTPISSFSTKTEKKRFPKEENASTVTPIPVKSSLRVDHNDKY